MSSQQDKIQKTNNPPLPGTCIVCAKSYNGNVAFLDFNLSLDWYGAVLFCEDCAGEMVSVIDFCPVAERSALENEVKLLHDKITELQDNNVRLNSTLDNLLAVRPSLRGDSDLSDESPHSDDEESATDSSTDTETNESETDESEHGSNEPATVGGSKNVSQSKFSGS